MTKVIGVDFGTTNSVVAVMSPDGRVRSKRFNFGASDFEVFRTVLCFSREGAGRKPDIHHSAGPAAIEAYLEDPFDSRLIMSMKTYLAQRSFTQTNIFGRIFTLEDMVALFLRKLLGAELAGAKIVAGRPIRFAGDFADDELGETRLRASYGKAGFSDIDVAMEPEAAGYWFARTLTKPAIVLTADFGGGTSDFSLLRYTPGDAHPVVSLGHSGIGIAGDNFDYRIIDHAVSPLLGKNDTYNIMGTDLPVPVAYFSGFARWHRLSMMRTPKMLRDIEEVARFSTHPERLGQLVHLIKDEQGYALYRAVSEVKAKLSHEREARLYFKHDEFLIDRLIMRDEFEDWVAPDIKNLSLTLDKMLQQASLQPADIDRVFLTGGTSFVPAVRGIFEQLFGAARLSSGGEFVSIAEGLAFIGHDRLVA